MEMVVREAVVVLTPMVAMVVREQQIKDEPEEAVKLGIVLAAAAAELILRVATPLIHLTMVGLGELGYLRQ